MTPPCALCLATTGGRRRIGLCPRCYRDLLATGERQRIVTRGIPGRRFMVKVDVNGPVPAHDPALGPCWLWTGAVTETGYGIFRAGPDTVVYAHRWVYEHAVDTIGEGLHVDHLCHDWATCGPGNPWSLADGICTHRRCVAPSHLAAVDPETNNARSASPTAVNARKDVCENGHEFSAANTYTHPVRGTRHCRACQREAAARYEGRRRMLVASADKRRAGRAPGEGQVELFEVRPQRVPSSRRKEKQP